MIAQPILAESWDRQKHVDMITCQHTAHNVDAHFIAGLPTNLAHRTLKHLVAVFRDSHDVEPVEKSRGRG